MRRAEQRSRLRRESEGEVDEAGWWYRRRVVCVVRDRKREVAGLMTGPSCKAMCSWRGGPTQGDMGRFDWAKRGIVDRPVVGFNGR